MIFQSGPIISDNMMRIRRHLVFSLPIQCIANILIWHDSVSVRHFEDTGPRRLPIQWPHRDQRPHLDRGDTDASVPIQYVLSLDPDIIQTVARPSALHHSLSQRAPARARVGNSVSVPGTRDGLAPPSRTALRQQQSQVRRAVIRSSSVRR